MRHILFIVTSADTIGTGQYAAGYEFSEVADPYFEFIKHGFTVDFASIKGGEPPFVGYDAAKKNDRTFMNSAGFKRLIFSHKLETIDVEAYDALFFPGGLGLMTDMLENATVKTGIRRAYESRKVIGAVCHGPSALLNVTLSDGSNLLAGKKINSFTKAEEELEQHTLVDVIPFMLETQLIQQGAEFSHAAPFECYVVKDARIVTGQNPASASKVALEMIDLIAEN